MEIDDIPVDKSGRSFFIKTSDGIVSYFWCSEKSKLLGTELRRKMKDLLTKKPSLADLTGISDSRLSCFAAHFRSYLAGSIITNTQISDDLSSTSVDPIVPSEIDFPQVGPGTYSLEESPRKSVSREKLRLISENYDVSVTSFNPSCQEDELPGADGTTHSMALLKFLDIAASELPCEIQASSSGPLLSPFSPHYCCCPLVASPMQSTIGNPHLLPASTESSLPTLPPLSVLLADIPPINFPTLPTEPLVQQIPTFTPLICDPIVHIPVIDICSSGQGYLVSGGHSVVVANPLLPKTGESVEKSARETLRMLISSQSNPLLLSKDEGNVMVGGSRGLYQDMDGGMQSMEAVLSLPRCVRRENLKDKKEEGLE